MQTYEPTKYLNSSELVSYSNIVLFGLVRPVRFTYKFINFQK